jgi:ribulose 1,5-bisphosphate synthetase/thiazole synthase
MEETEKLLNELKIVLKEFEKNEVNVHDWHALSESFRAIIEAGYENIEL